MAEMNLGDAIRQMIDSNKRLKSGLNRLRIEDVWKEKMGSTIAKYTDSIQFFNKKLMITTSVAPLKHELHYQKDKIIALVNEALGEDAVEEVIIK